MPALSRRPLACCTGRLDPRIVSSNTFGKLFCRHHLRRKPRAGDRLRDRRLPAGPRDRRGRVRARSRAPRDRQVATHLAAARGRRGRDPLAASIEGRTTGTPIALLIRNTDARSKDYEQDRRAVPPRPCRLHLLAEVRHPRSARRRAQFGARDHHAGRRGGDRAGNGWRSTIGVRVRGYCRADRRHHAARLRLGRGRGAIRSSGRTPRRSASSRTYMDALRKSGDSVGARVDVVADGVPPGWGEPIYGKLDADLAAAMMSINAVKGVEIGDGFAAVAQKGSVHRDEMTARRLPSATMPAASSAASPAASRSPCSVAFKPTSSLRLPGRTMDVRGQGGRGRHHRPPRSLRRHARHADLRGDDGAGADGPGAAASRAMRRCRRCSPRIRAPVHRTASADRSAHHERQPRR